MALLKPRMPHRVFRGPCGFRRPSLLKSEALSVKTGFRWGRDRKDISGAQFPLLLAATGSSVGKVGRSQTGEFRFRLYEKLAPSLRL